MRLDNPVTKDLKRVLRLPFSVHGKSLKLVLPFDPARVAEFNIEETPSVFEAAANAKLVDPYVAVLKSTFFP